MSIRPPSIPDRRSDGPFTRFERSLEAAVHRPGAFWWLLLATAIENTFVPLTVEPIVVPLMAIYRDRIVSFAVAMALGSIIGGLIMYGLGVAIAAGAAGWFEGLASARATGFSDRLETQGFVAILIFAVSPLPYQVATTGAGLAGYPFLPFLIAIVLGRGTLYGSFALAAWAVGPRISAWMDRYKMPVLIAGTILALIIITLTLFRP